MHELTQSIIYPVRYACFKRERQSRNQSVKSIFGHTICTNFPESAYNSKFVAVCYFRRKSLILYLKTLKLEDQLINEKLSQMKKILMNQSRELIKTFLWNQLSPSMVVEF